jgi:O-antigen/teichoic acid export membrane protein
VTDPGPASESADHSRELARGGIASSLGSIISAVTGFALTIVLARMLGDSGSGVILQAIAIYTIVLSFARSGMDSSAVWIMPRLAQSEPLKIRSALGFMLVVTAVISLILGIATVLLAPVFAHTGDQNSVALANSIEIVGWFMPAGALLLVALSATRGLGGVWPYVAVGSIALPTSRPLVVAAIAAAGGSLSLVALGWAAPLPLALIAALLVLRAQVRRHEKGTGAHGQWKIDAPLRRSIWTYALPRVISAGLEQSVLWLDVLLVGIVGGSAAAGVYGGASRFIAAGLIVDTSIRVVISPRFSTLLSQGRISEVDSLYRTGATWLVVFSTPIYIILGVFAPVVLGWLGPDFVSGSAALAILCVGAVLTFTAGNIHSLLLMSGRSGWGAFNKAVVLGINIVGNVLLIPVWGINGAALTWAVSMLVDAVLASIEVRRFIGIGFGLRSIGYALLVPLVTVGVPAAVLYFTLGATLLSMILAIVIGGIALLAWCFFDRDRLYLKNLSLLARRLPPAA